MAIGERINFFRNLKGMTMKYFGMSIGFIENQADVRISQYESSKRSPKENIISEMAKSLDVSPEALDVPNIDSYTGLMHTLFTLEDIYGLRIGEIDGELCLRLSKNKKNTFLSMFDMFSAWNEVSKKYKDEQISKDDYDHWRYNYPKFDTSGQWHALVPSLGLSERLVEELKVLEKGNIERNDFA